MAQLLPRDTIGERLGTGLGAGLTQGFQQLAQQKMQELQQRTNAARLQQNLENLGIPNAQAAAQLPEKLLLRYLENNPAPQQAAGGAGQQSPLAQTVGGMFANPQERRHQEAQSTKKEIAANTRFDKFILPELRSANEAKKAKQQENDVLARIAETTKMGNVQESLAFWANLAEHSGINLDKLFNADTAEIKKFQSQAFKHGAKTFGGRVSNIEFKALMDAFPSLLQSPEGRIRVAELIQIGNEPELKKADIMQEIVEEYPNITPSQFDSLVAKRMKPIYEEASRKFLEYGRDQNQQLEALPDINSEPDDAEFMDAEGNAWGKNAAKTDWVIIRKAR